MSTLASTAAVDCRYCYDALDRLAAFGIQAQEPIWPFYQRSRLSVEIQGALHRRVVRVQDRLLAEQHVDGLVDQVVLLGTDVQDSVLQALDGHGSQSFGYSPYGHRPPAKTLLGFNGERPDTVTGHYLLGNGYRAFNPVLMRFNQPDSLSPFGRGGLNAYAYCSGDPVNRNDPGGHISGFRVPGLTMFPSTFQRLRQLHLQRLKNLSFQTLPDLVLTGVFKNLDGKNLTNLSRTSVGMSERVKALSGMPTLDPASPNALQDLAAVLKGERANALPSRLKEPVWKSRIERILNDSDIRQSELLADVARQDSFAQPIMNRVVRSGEADATREQFSAAMHARLEIPGGDVAWREVQNRIFTNVTDAWSHRDQRFQEYLDLSALTKSIRSNLATR